MISYIYDFLSILFDKTKEKDKIRTIMLFGSFARGNPRKDSDIDIFIDVVDKDKEEISEIVREALDEFELKATKTWHQRGIKNAIVPITDNILKEQWSELRKDIAIYGKVLYGKYRAESANGKHAILIEYDLTKIKQKEKVRVLRKLYGYRLKKGKKEYVQQGLASQVKGEKIKNAFLVEISDYQRIIEFLKENKIPKKIREIWVV